MSSIAIKKQREQTRSRVRPLKPTPSDMLPPARPPVNSTIWDQKFKCQDCGTGFIKTPTLSLFGIQEQFQLSGPNLASPKRSKCCWSGLQLLCEEHCCVRTPPVWSLSWQAGLPCDIGFSSFLNTQHPHLHDQGCFLELKCGAGSLGTSRHHFYKT